MLRIQVELLPGGDDSRARRIATIEIANTGQLKPGDVNTFLYDWTLTERTEDGHLDAGGGMMEHHRKHGMVALLHKVLGVYLSSPRSRVAGILRR